MTTLSRALGRLIVCKGARAFTYAPYMLGDPNWQVGVLAFRQGS
jgi:hypothetical protein